MKGRLLISVVCGAVLSTVLFSYKLLTKPKKQSRVSAPVDNKKSIPTLAFGAAAAFDQKIEIAKAIALQQSGGDVLFTLNLKPVNIDPAPAIEPFFQKYPDYIITILLMTVLSVITWFILPLIYPHFELKKGP